MKNSIVSHSDPVLLIGGGPLLGAQLPDLLEPQFGLVACDGGVSHVMAAGLTGRLDAVIGDLDSLPAEAGTLPLHRVSEQDSTDFHKALRNIEAPLVIGAGFWGGRVDHQLAAVSVLVALAHRPCILLAGEDILFAAPPDIAMTLEAETRVSIWPLLPVEGRSEGLHWPIDDLVLAPTGRLGTSNRADGGTMRLRFTSPGAVVILPRAQLAQAAQRLRDAPRWPVPAG